MQLAAALHLPLGRAIALTADSAQQLLGQAEDPLSVQLVDTVQAQRALLLELLRAVARPNYDQRRDTGPQPLLLEGEHPAWPLLALARGGVLSSEETAQALRRAVRLSSDTSAQLNGNLSLAYWLADALLSVAESLLLSQWGILLTYASLQRQFDPLTERRKLAQQLLQRPELLQAPDELSHLILWAALFWMHGGQELPTPSAAAQRQILVLVGALPSLQEHTTIEPLPSAAGLQQWLAHWLPALTPQESERLTKQWQSPPPPADHAYLSGITALRVPGQVALWRRSRNELHVVVLSSPAAPRPVAWQWQL